MATPKKAPKYRPEYPYTLLVEAIDQYRAEVFRDDEARNRFLVHIQPLVRHCVGRFASSRGGGAVKRIDDVVGFANVKLLESWLPTYLAGKRKVDRVREAASYFVTSIRGYVLDFIKKNYDPRVAPLVDNDRSRSLICKGDKEELDAAYERMLAEHVALRLRPDLDMEVVEKLMRHLVWEGYRSTDGLPG